MGPHVHNTTSAYATDDERWTAVRDRDELADGRFYYVVRTTGVYSRPSCVARLARRENVEFFSTVQEARAAGYRQCRRCRPDEPGLQVRHAAAVTKACRLIERAPEPPSLDDLARAVGFSRFHFHRVFKSVTGVTPHSYLVEGRAQRVRSELSGTGTVADAIYSAGFNSNGHFYAALWEMLGMTPTSFRSGGRGAVIRFAVGHCSLGPVLVAVANKGVCAVLLGADGPALRRELADRFPRATLLGGEPSFDALVTGVLVRADLPSAGRDLLPADVRRTALCQRVRQALRRIPAHTGLRAG